MLPYIKRNFLTAYSFLHVSIDSQIDSTPNYIQTQKNIAEVLVKATMTGRRVRNHSAIPPLKRLGAASRFAVDLEELVVVAIIEVEFPL